MRIAVFVDYWNLQLTLNSVISEQKGVKDHRVQVNWKGLGPILAAEAGTLLGVAQAGFSYEGIHIYTSYNPSKAEGLKYKA